MHLLSKGKAEETGGTDEASRNTRSEKPRVRREQEERKNWPTTLERNAGKQKKFIADKTLKGANKGVGSPKWCSCKKAIDQRAFD